jgi:hypothetical protein
MVVPANKGNFEPELNENEGWLLPEINENVPELNATCLQTRGRARIK